jgi:hypothetical protein
MLERVGGGAFLRREPEYRRELYEEIRRLALERYEPEVDAALPFNLRVRARLLRQGRYDALGVLARFESELRAEVKVRHVRGLEAGGNDKLAIELEASIGGGAEPFFLVRRGARIHWLLPEPLREELPEQTLDLTDELEKARVQVLLRSRRDETEYVVPTASELVLLRAPGTRDVKRPVLVAVANVERDRAAAGSLLPRGEWEVHALVEVAGFNAFTRTLRQPGRLRSRERTLALMATRDGRLLTRPPLGHRAAQRFPRVAGLAKRLRPWTRRDEAHAAA